MDICESLNHELFARSSAKPVNDELVESVNYIIENVYMKRFSTTNICSAVEDHHDPYFVNFKESLLLKNKGFCILRLDNQSHIQQISNRLKIYNIFLLDTFKSFEILNERIRSDQFNFRGYYLFVLVGGLIPEIGEIFRMLWEKYIINVNVIYDNNGTVTLGTFRPYNHKTCWSTDLLNFAEFKNGNFGIDATVDIFPDKLRNMYECDVRLVTFHRCPAVCVEKIDGKLTATGFDIGIIELIAESMNFTLKKSILLGDEQWGTIFPNKSTSGGIRKIVEGEAEIAIGNYILRANRLKIMDSSNVYFSFPVVFAIPLGERLTPFEKLLRPFEYIVWAVLGIFILIGALVIFIINWKLKQIQAFVFGTGIKNPIVNMIAVIFGGTQIKLPRRNFSRFLLMMFLLFCLVKRNVYQGLLYIFLQSDGRHKGVQSIDEMHQKGFDFLMYESYTDIIQSQPKIYNK